MKTELIIINNIGHLSVEIENIEEKRLLLLSLMANYTIQRYYWRSKFDQSIEYIEPKIFDCFTFVADCYGPVECMRQLIDDYTVKQGVAGYLDSMNKSELTENQIKNYAQLFLQSLNKTDVNI